MSVNEFTGSAEPSVTSDQWVVFALRKLADGFSLVQTTSGKAFNFRKPGLAMQPCDPRAAKKLLRADTLEAVKVDGFGTHYRLKSDVAAHGDAVKGALARMGQGLSSRSRRAR